MALPVILIGHDARLDGERDIPLVDGVGARYALVIFTRPTALKGHSVVVANSARAVRGVKVAHHGIAARAEIAACGAYLMRELWRVMNVISIEYPTQLKHRDVLSDNIDIFVKLDNNTSYCITVATIKWIDDQVKRKGFLESGSPFLIVERLEENIIEKAIKDYALNDAYWLKVLSLSIGDELIV